MQSTLNGGVRERNFLNLRQYYESWANNCVADVLSRIVRKASKKLPGAPRQNAPQPPPPPIPLGGPDCRYRRQIVYTVFFLTSNCGLSSSSNTNARSASLNIIKRMLLILSSHTGSFYKFMREKYYEIYNLYIIVHYANNSNNAIHGY
jgi:hypothetical protein